MRASYNIVEGDFGMPSPGRLRIWCLVLAAAALLYGAQPAHAVRVMVYNTLRYPGLNITVPRLLAFHAIVTDAAPDMIIAVEMINGGSALRFGLDVLDAIEPGQWAFAPFSDLGGLSVVVFYKTAVFDDLGGAINITGDPRHTRRWHFRLDGYASNDASFFPLGMHLKAGNTSSDQSRRATTTTNIRVSSNAFFSPTDRWFYCGDLNLKTSAELAYADLTESQGDNDGQSIDVHNPNLFLQSWTNNSVFAFIHTQSTRAGSLGDGGASGGMDDQFDFILMSDQLMQTTGLSFIPGTYRVYGQDALHFNNDVNAAPTNADVGQALADDLQIASDHLPLLIDLQVPAKVSADQAVLDFGTVSIGAMADLVLTVSDAATLADPEDLSYSFAAPAGFTAPAGGFTHAVGDPGNGHTISMDTTTTGIKSGTLVINSNDLDTPALNITVMGVVVPGVLGDLSGNGSVGLEDSPLLVALLLDPAAASQADRDTADMNGDTANDGDDIQLFIAALVP